MPTEYSWTPLMSNDLVEREMADDLVKRVLRLEGALKAAEENEILVNIDDSLKTCADVRARIRAPEAENAKLREALKALLARDERNTCQHENTYRGGVLWEICADCDAKWADDEGGKPEWRDPPEWTEARAVLAKEPT